jgi:hypothetical protein
MVPYVRVTSSALTLSTFVLRECKTGKKRLESVSGGDLLPYSVDGLELDIALEEGEM